MTEIFFFDTYAVIETIKGNPNYQRYISAKFILTKLNLFEIYYVILRDFDETLANNLVKKYLDNAVDFDLDVIAAAAKRRLAAKKQHLSMTDCIGYAISIKYGIKFLTGDKEFEGLQNVEFVK